MKILSVVPPLVQINTPYPSTTFLTGFLREKGFDAHQTDLGLRLILKVFSKEGLIKLRDEILKKKNPTPAAQFFCDAFPDYESTIDVVIQFLQGKNPELAYRIAARTILPEGPRFSNVDQEDLKWAFGVMGVQDQAKHLASLYLDDLADIIQSEVDPDFSLSRYAEKIAASQSSFDPIWNRLHSHTSTLIEILYDQVIDEVLQEHSPDVFLVSVPFPGTVYFAFYLAKKILEKKPSVKMVLGGGYVNTELRSVRDPRVLKYFHAITLDDGERPVLQLLSYFQGNCTRSDLVRTFLKHQHLDAVEWIHRSDLHDIPQNETGYPTTDGLPLGSYLSMVELLNPMHRFWSDGFWNKLMLAHGCYWAKCSFCDVTLDYIKRYEKSPVDLTLERMRRLRQETGSSGFHFIDEAAPPAVLRELSDRLIETKEKFSWWGNIRFEKAFTDALCEKMADAGCVAVSGGLEVASDRLLKKMNKGVTVEQVARVSHSFQKHGVLVHAYLMYGFPTQTLQETIDSLERVRQLFQAGCLTSAFWHRFSVTAHSPVGKDPEAYGVHLMRDEVQFSENDLSFHEEQSDVHDRVGTGLRKAVYNYMHGIGLDQDVRSWFEFKVPKSTVDSKMIFEALKK